MCGLFQLLSTSQGYHCAKFCSHMTSSCSRTLEKPQKMHVFRVKKSHFQVIFRPLRRGTGQNLMKHGWKRIFRWFRISNQIFHSIYRSRVIRRSLDLVLAVLTKNANFMDEYLENGASFWRAVFFCWSVSFSSTFWPKIIKIVWVVFEKSWKNLIFWPFWPKMPT